MIDSIFSPSRYCRHGTVAPSMAMILVAVLLLLASGRTESSALPAEPFEMSLNDVFQIRGRGPVLTGHVIAGRMAVGDSAMLVGPRDTLRTRVVRIEKFRKRLQVALAGPGNISVELSDAPPG